MDRQSSPVGQWEKRFPIQTSKKVDKNPLYSTQNVCVRSATFPQ